MKDFWNAIGLIAVAVIVILIIKNWDKLKAYLGMASSPVATTTDATSTSTSTGTTSIPANGTLCTTTLGATGSYFNGACIPTPLVSTNIKVTNTNGARIYNFYGAYTGHPALFVPTNAHIQYNTVVAYTQANQTQTLIFYKTQAGWVSSADVQTV